MYTMVPGNQEELGKSLNAQLRMINIMYEQYHDSSISAVSSLRNLFGFRYSQRERIRSRHLRQVPQRETAKQKCGVSSRSRTRKKGGSSEDDGGASAAGDR